LHKLIWKLLKKNSYCKKEVFNNFEVL
jgi:hypothetical protein